ncbi:hypothetical protein [Pseudomonas mangiferae]|uniref:Uncharacterized protein n=1 Tax=Pseudomonas mangiferae TaxID=2593654 RepID=A0A553H3S5_9PSED|nr:hypothetical protein [Pseudomonas mangiferae]TRX76401.1 hypothetical protein FM069_04210 [Pseudomonas mangiferae]
MKKSRTTEFGYAENQASPVHADDIKQNVRALTELEVAELRKNMADSSAWMKAELLRRHRMKV